MTSGRERGQKAQAENQVEREKNKNKRNKSRLKERTRKEGHSRWGNCNDGIVVSAEAAVLSSRAENVDEGRGLGSIIRGKEGRRSRIQSAPPRTKFHLLQLPQAVQIENDALLPARETNEYLGTLAFQKMTSALVQRGMEICQSSQRSGDSESHRQVVESRRVGSQNQLHAQCALNRSIQRPTGKGTTLDSTRGVWEGPSRRIAATSAKKAQVTSNRHKRGGRKRIGS